MNIHNLAEKISEKVFDLFFTDLEYYPHMSAQFKWHHYDDKNSTVEITCEPRIFEAVLKKAVEEVLDKILKETLYLTTKTNIKEIMEVMNIETQSREEAGKLDEEDHCKSDSDGQSGSQESCQLQSSDHVIRNFYPSPANPPWKLCFDPDLFGLIARPYQYPDCFRPLIDTGFGRCRWS